MNMLLLGQQFCYENKIQKLHVYINITYLRRFDRTPTVIISQVKIDLQEIQ